MRPARIPLFPLDIVLFPRMPLPLHIFEPRYKAMVNRCLEAKTEFGMVYAEARSIATVGCTAEIVRLSRKYFDGRMDILTEGRAAFRIVELHTDKDLYEAVVDYLPEDVTPQDSHKESELMESFQQCHLLLFGHAWPRGAPRDSAGLANQLASRLPLDPKQRQALLEMRSESDRRDFLLRYAEELLPRLAQRHVARQRVGGNGFGVH